MRTLAMIMAGGRGSRLAVLSDLRTKPAVPFAGKYRIIDFTLSNCVNSGINNVGIVTQYNPRSLTEHIRSGGPWDLDRLHGGVALLHPYLGRDGNSWYAGTADAIYQNVGYIKESRADYVVILAGDHIYKMDYSIMLNFHIDKNADITIATLKVPIEEASRFGILSTDDSMRVTAFEEKPKNPKGTLASMGIYIFNADVLVRKLSEDAREKTSEHDFGKNIIPGMLAGGDAVYAFPFGGYWVDVGTIQSYWETHMELLTDRPALDLNDREWIIHTRSEERPPVNIRSGAVVNHSQITDGCVIEGSVEYSVLSPGVRVGRGAIVRQSIILTDAVIEPGAVIDRCIIDKRVTIGRDAHVGYGTDYRKNSCLALTSGISVVGKNTVVPNGLRVGRNVIIGADLGHDAFPPEFVQSGDCVGWTPSE